ncbi:hypothetical protein HYS93_02180 [Candidatus Daviesbacteria bacterium]|nr:hypothetical protein [Candidatus Daviesbacteria bacterium]
MRFIIILILVLTVLGGVYFFNQKSKTESNQIPNQTSKQTEPEKITESQAVNLVKKRPEVADFLKRVPGGHVQVNNELDGEYNIQVFEVKDGHTATFNWYRVNIKTGSIKAEFDFTVESSGKVSGRLCYPSEFLPEGTIEAKRLSDGQIFTQNYPGSNNGGKNTYSFELESGDYYLRYKISDKFNGYSTTVCPTGQDESCGDTKPREIRKAEVKADQTVLGYDLCDFYYRDSNAPKF